MGRCIEIRHVGCCAYGVDFTHSPSAARWVYATSCTLIVPSVSRRTVKGTSAVVVIGVDRGERGSDDGTAGACPCLMVRAVLVALGGASLRKAKTRSLSTRSARGRCSLSTK